MPRKPRNSPNPPGRPRVVPPEVVADLAAGKVAPEDAAAKLGVARSTAYAARARKGGVTGSAAGGAAGAPAGTPAARQAPPKARAVQVAPADRRAALLAALADAFDASPALVDSLPADPGELARLLAGALPEEGDLDVLRILRRVQARTEADLVRLPLEAVVARRSLNAELIKLAKAIEAIVSERPPVGETPEQIAARMIAERRDKALKKMFEEIEAEEAA